MFAALLGVGVCEVGQSYQWVSICWGFQSRHFLVSSRGEEESHRDHHLGFQFQCCSVVIFLIGFSVRFVQHVGDVFHCLCFFADVLGTPSFFV